MRLAIPAEALYRLSKEQTGKAFPTAQFNAWMKRHNLSLSAAAQAVHLTWREFALSHDAGCTRFIKRDAVHIRGTPHEYVTRLRPHRAIPLQPVE